MTMVTERVDKIALDVVLRDPGPVVSVYLGPAPAVANEYQLGWGARWRPLAEALRRDGVDEATIVALADELADTAAARAASGMHEAAAFARGGRVLAVFRTPGAGWPDTAGVSAPARVLPLLAWAQQRPPYVLVTIDRAGGDIEASPGGAGPARTRTVDGPDDEIERNSPGGFLAQGRYQRRAEDSWRHNAAAVAERVGAELDRVGARLLVVSGDVRAVQLLRERLPDWVRRNGVVHQIHGSRATDGSQRHRAELVAAAVREAVAHQLGELLDAFADRRSPDGRTVEGAHATLDALAEGRVGTLLVSQVPGDDGRHAWFGAGPTEVQPTDQPPPPWPEPHLGGLVDVAVRAAWLTGAEVRVVPAGDERCPASGLGGICRFR